MSIDQIKFRGRVKRLIPGINTAIGQWVISTDLEPKRGLLVIPDDMKDQGDLIYQAAGLHNFWHYVSDTFPYIDPATVGQWSMRKATNGKDIYAGHYVRVEFPRDDTPGCVVEGAVVMLDGVFTIYQGDEGICLLHKCYSTDQEIIIEIIEEASDG